MGPGQDSDVDVVFSRNTVSQERSARSLFSVESKKSNKEIARNLDQRDRLNLSPKQKLISLAPPLPQRRPSEAAQASRHTTNPTHGQRAAPTASLSSAHPFYESEARSLPGRLSSSVHLFPLVRARASSPPGPLTHH